MILILYLIFDNYNVFQISLFYVYLIWVPSGLMVMDVHFSPKVQEISAIIVLNIHSIPLCVSSPLGIHVVQYSIKYCLFSLCPKILKGFLHYFSFFFSYLIL